MHNAPRFDASNFTIKDLCRIYRAIDIIEEGVNIAHNANRNLNDQDTPTSDYLAELQEYLSAERVSIVDALRAFPNTDDRDGHSRLATTIQFEAWCEEFRGETLKQLSASSLTSSAIQGGLEAAILADEEFLASHPVKRSGRSVPC